MSHLAAVPIDPNYKPKPTTDNRFFIKTEPAGLAKHSNTHAQIPTNMGDDKFIEKIKKGNCKFGDKNTTF
jgi:hypothetical protein